MISFDLYPAPNGNTTATDGETTKSGSDPCRSIARDLVDAGMIDQPWEMRRDGRKVMHGPSLHWLAASVVNETDAGFSRGWWARHPRSAPRPALEAVVEQQRALAKERKRQIAAELAF